MKLGIDQPARRRPQQQRNALQHAQHGDRRDDRVDAGEAHHPAIRRADRSPASRQPAMPERQLRRSHGGADDEGGEHHRHAHHRADRNVEAAHQQHVELRHGDQRQRRRGKQYVAQVDRGQEDVRLQRRVEADQRRQRQQEAAAGSTICCCRPTASRRRGAAGSAARVRAFGRQRLPGHQEGRDDVFLGHLVAGQLADDAAAREHQDAVADAGELQRVGGIDDAAGAVGHLGADRAVDVEAGAGIDALRRLVDQHDVGAIGEAAGQHRLLLVAAGEAADRLLQARRHDAVFAHQRARPRRAPCGPRRGRRWRSGRAPAASCSRARRARGIPIPTSGRR